MLWSPSSTTSITKRWVNFWLQVVVALNICFQRCTIWRGATEVYLTAYYLNESGIVVLVPGVRNRLHNTVDTFALLEKHMPLSEWSKDEVLRWVKSAPWPLAKQMERVFKAFKEGKVLGRELLELSKG